MARYINIVILGVGLALAGMILAQNPAATRIRGDIVSISGDKLTVHRHSGDTVIVTVGSATSIAAVRKMAMSDIKHGAFIGTAARPDAKGNLLASEVVVFPEAERGRGEGHYAWDFGPHSTMTNANVDAIVDSTDGRDLHLSYKGGKQTVTVPAGVPIVTFIPAGRSDLLAGKKVFVAVAPGPPGKLVAQRIVVEKDGVAPPM